MNSAEMHGISSETPCATQKARKDDTDKPSYSLLPPDALAELVKAYDIGSRKYSRGNWENGMEWHRVFDALQRHAWAFWSGEDHDSDGQHHLASVAWCALTLIAYQKRGIGMDDRGVAVATELSTQVDIG
jgi:hypothetical protein